MTRNRSRIGSLLGAAISVGALVVLARFVDLGAAADSLRGASLGPLIAIVPVLAIQLALRSLRWRVLLTAGHPERSIAVGRLVPVLLVGYLANAVLPARLGEPIRAYLVARREQLDPAESFGTVVLERVLDTASLAVVAAIAAALSPVPEWLARSLAVVAAIGVVVVLLLLAGVLRPIVRLLDRLAARAPGLLELPARLGHRVSIGAEAAAGNGATIFAIAVSSACWLLDATTFWLVGTSLGIDLSPAGAVLIAAVTVLGTALPSAPGYLGTFDLAATATATALGVAPSSAAVLAVLAHAVTLLPLAAGGAISLGASGLTLGDLVSGADTPGPKVDTLGS